MNKNMRKNMYELTNQLLHWKKVEKKVGIKIWIN